MAGIESPAKLLYLQMRHRRPRTQRQGGTKKKEESRIHDAVTVTPAVYQRSFNQKRHPHGGLFRSIKDH